MILMAYENEISWKNTDDLGYVKFKNVEFDKPVKFPTPGLGDWVYLEIVDKSNKSTLAECRFYFTDKNKTNPEAQQFMQLVREAHSGNNSGLFSNLKYGLNANGSMFLVPTKDIKIVG